MKTLSDSDFAHVLKDGTKLKRPSEIKTPLPTILKILKKPTMTGNQNQKTTSFQPKQTQILFTILLRRFLISKRKWRIRRKMGDFPNAIWTFLRLWDLHLFCTGRGGILKLPRSSSRNPNNQSLNPELTHFFRKFAGFDQKVLICILLFVIPKKPMCSFLSRNSTN